MKGQAVPLDRLSDFIGRRRVSEEWFRVTQQRVDQFADATLDHQFIHVDPGRASRTPFGGTVAHGFLTLSLLPRLMEPIQVLPENTVLGINYGLNRVRFPNPVPVDSEIRAAATLLEIADSAPGRITLTTEVTVEIRGQDKPALAAETLTMFLLDR
jgi:acyl dehydratase